ncbi:MAG TPA: GNAT family N-acetyltransferase [Egibacteraceae bacterium]|nr:GNAT family N-acetyltransferase [Egibacteraceae bacterium]
MTDHIMRELAADEAHLAAAALLALRPHFAGEDAITAAVRRQMAQGYRLLAAFAPGDPAAAAVAGFRVVEYLAWGRALYVDDLSTREEHRRAGHARALLDELMALAEREGCAQFHLDSGFGASRANAHRLYYEVGLYPTSLHFSSRVPPTPRG